jgi:CDP-diglyceride synthetase
MSAAIQLLGILLACNGAPLLLARLLGSRGAAAIDMNRVLADGRPLFGASKTWRGFFAMPLAGALLCALLDCGWHVGLMLGFLAAVGDLFSSFVKRRLGLEAGARCNGLDQLPESALPSLYAVSALELPWHYALLVPLAFWGAQRLLSKVLYRLHLRQRPY